MKFFGTTEDRELTAPPCLGSLWLSLRPLFKVTQVHIQMLLVVSETYRCRCPANSLGTLDALVISETAKSVCENSSFGRVPVLLTPKLPVLRQAPATM